MAYSLFGFRSGVLDTASLRIKLSRHNASLRMKTQVRVIHVYGFGAAGVNFWNARLGRDFENFCLLDDVAIEACKILGIDTGEPLGIVELNDAVGLAIGPSEFPFNT